MKRIITITILSIAFIACKKESKGPFKGAGPGEKVKGGYIVSRDGDGHGIMMTDSNLSTEKGCNWATAVDLCKKAKNGDYNDWRLPTIAELKTMSDDLFLKNIGNWPNPQDYTLYWGGEYTTDSAQAAILSTKEVIVKPWRKTGLGFVRAVRNY